MKYAKFYLFVTGLFSCMASPILSAEIEVSIEIPRLTVSEYHRPYVAVWIEDDSRTAQGTLTVWYQQKSQSRDIGTKWLPDLRQWWRRAGRDMTFPVDGVSGATRAAGKHVLRFTESDPQLNELKSGKYQLVVEAAREVGGRELLKIPFNWPPQKATSSKVDGKEELGTIRLELKP